MSLVDPTAAATMAEVLQLRAAQSPEALAFCFLSDGEHEGPRLSYAALDRGARAVARALADVAGAGERALLVYPPGLDFVVAFFGCQYAGVAALPVYPPRLDRRHASWQGLTNIAADGAPRVVLTSRDLQALLGRGRGSASLESACWIATDELDPASPTWQLPEPRSEATALLQYTSGSTALPRGVVISQRNLLHNERILHAAFEHRGPGLGVSWLPPYHDMGLIGAILQTVFHGAACVLMSPLAFLHRPYAWLRAISHYRADTSGGPNFAYDLCVERVSAEERGRLDLSCWSVAAIGSEPVSPATMERFAAAFGPCGFRREAFYPCYGLAEATLFVTGGAKQAAPVVRSFSAQRLAEGKAIGVPGGDPDARLLVGCGHPWGEEVLIVDPETTLPCADDQVGEIWIAGPSVAQGYWNRPEQTQHIFRARLAGRDTGPYLRSGDLGFLHEGDLFVTGRLKDLIVIRGRNHYPEDIEATLQSVDPALRAGCGAAFEVVRNDEAVLVCVQEVERRCRDLDLPRLIGDLRQAIAERHELHLHDVQLLQAGTIPKTTSGKVQRHRCRSGYEQGTLSVWRGTRQ